MIATPFCRRPLLAALIVLLSAAAPSVSAQLIPGLVPKPNISVFGAIPVNLTPNFGYVAPVLVGYSLGGFYQTPRFVGVEVRGSMQRRVSAEHQESVLAGPRIALHFGHISPYVGLLGGVGNGWRFQNPPVAGKPLVQPVEGLGPQWTVLGGADVHFTRQFAIRIGEISYSKLYLKDWNLTPLNVSAGIVIRLF